MLPFKIQWCDKEDPMKKAVAAGTEQAAPEISS